MTLVRNTGAGEGPVLVLEVGGTSMRAGCFDRADQVLRSVERRPSPNYLASAETDPFTSFLDVLRRLAEQALRGGVPSRVALAFPGPVDARGDVLAGPTIFGAIRAPLPLGVALRSWWPRADVTVLNDLTAAGYRHAAAGGRDFCIVTVGSGIGHKVFLDGRPVVGGAGRGGELGHLQVDPSQDAPVCDCGDRGHLGGIASGRGSLRAVRAAAAREPDMARRSLGRDDPTTTANDEVAAAFRAGDPWVTDALRPGIGHLGRALASVHLAIGVEQFVLVGGFALALGDRYRRLVCAAADRSSWDLGQTWDEMVALGADDDNHGMIGAGLYAAGMVGR